MMSKKVLPVALSVVVVLVLLFAKSWGKEKTSEPSSKYERILTSVAAWLEQEHFSPKKLDDKFSQEVFARFLKSMDPDKSIALQSDIDALKKYENQVDNEMRTGKTELVPALNEMIVKRSAEVEALCNSLLIKPFEFSANEVMSVDRDKAAWPKTEAERKELWRKKLKYMVLERYVEAQEIREKNKDSANFTVKADSTLERESRDRVRKIWQRTFDRQKKKNTQDDVFNLYVNTISETMDPHTQFFPPVEKRAFEEQMSGTFFGIGAQLQEQDGNIKIAALVTGTPAWKSGEIQAGDIILKVAQGADEPVDITGFETTDAVKLIRGKKGTEVRLTLKKTDGSIKVVKLIRDEIVQEEAYARSAIIKGENKIGYIYLPDFYINFNDPNGAACAKDVAKELIKLKAENVDGVVLDLRFNGGGSLPETIKMVGLFIEDGPVVQVKGRDGTTTVLTDKDKNVLYTGPLAVMINEYSASASEIFAGAIQDYKRGVIVGSQSFGKGTVQRQVSLDGNSGFLIPSSEMGSLKLTIQKFYRISGGSNQLKGIQPDVKLPDNLEFTETREKNEPDALPWDEIEKANYSTWTGSEAYKSIEQQYQQKVDANPAFKEIRNNAEWLSKESKNDVSLNLNAYKESQKKIRATVKRSDSLQTIKTPMDVSFIQADAERIDKMDKEKGDRFKAWLKGLKTDLYLEETTKVMNNLIANSKTASN